MHNLVIFSLTPWNIDYGANIKDLSLEFAKDHRVLYIDVPLKRKERWFKSDKPQVREVRERIGKREYLKEVQPNLWHYIAPELLESVNQLKNDFLFDTINHVNNKRFAKAIKKAIREVGFDEYVLLNDNDIYNGFYLKELLKPSIYLYYLRDKLSAMRYWKAHASRLEPKLIATCDAVVANSEYLAAYAAEYNPNSHYVGQGCDVTQFLKEPKQEDIDKTFAGIQRPIVGYVGALNSERLDIELLTTLAERMKDVSFVLVGPEDETFRNSALHGLSNVHFPGKKDFSELPVYMYGFDVCMNPQGLNEITIGNYPRKVDEYLATGRPVVATETHAMNPFREHVYLGKTADDYDRMIRQALTENTEAKAAARRAFACEHTWENNAREIVQVIDAMKVKNNVAV